MSPPAFTQEARLFIYFFVFLHKKFGLCLFNQVTTKMLSNEQIISTQNTYTSFTNVASGCAKRLPSDRPTELNKPQTKVFLIIEGRKESHECFVSFFPLYNLRNLLHRSREKPWPVVNPWLAEGNVPRGLTQANNVTSSSDWFMGMRGHL